MSNVIVRVGANADGATTRSAAAAYRILNLAKAGDEVRDMLGVTERKSLIEQFARGCPAGGPWDALLFSGGGNDIVDNPMVLWIRDFNATLPPAALIHQARLDAASRSPIKSS